MPSSGEEALALLNKWQRDESRLRFALSGRGLLLWQNWGKITSVVGTQFNFSRPGESDFTIDIKGSKLEIQKVDDVPATFDFVREYLDDSVLQITTKFGDIILLFPVGSSNLSE